MAFGKKNKITLELSEVAKRHSIRVSKPNGYYPEDVDRVLVSLEDQIASLLTENKRLGSERDRLKRDIDILQGELVSQRLNMSRLTLPENNLEEDMQNISKISKITGIDAAPVEVVDDEDPLQTTTIVEPYHQNEKTQGSAVLDTGELDIIEL